MALGFNGSTQNAYKSNGITGIDVSTFTMSVHAKITGGPATGFDMLFADGDVLNGETGAEIVAHDSGANWRAKFDYRWSTTYGIWIYNTDLNLNQWYRIVVTYDRGATTNNPRMWLDGSEVTLTKTSTPAGAAKSAIDSAFFASDQNQGFRSTSHLAEGAFWDRILTDSEIETTLGQNNSPDFITSGLQVYWRLQINGDEEMQDAGLTLVGSPTEETHPPIVSPVIISSGVRSDDRMATAQIRQGSAMFPLGPDKLLADIGGAMVTG